jgi:hypothetical protein
VLLEHLEESLVGLARSAGRASSFLASSTTDLSPLLPAKQDLDVLAYRREIA